jgi:hypothetical protein
MRRIERWALVVAIVLGSMLASAISAGAAFAAGAPPAGGFWGGAEGGQGGKGIDRSLLLHRDSADWTPAIVLVVAIIVVLGVILALSRQTRERNARSAGAVTPTVTG